MNSNHELKPEKNRRHRGWLYAGCGLLLMLVCLAGLLLSATLAFQLIDGGSANDAGTASSSRPATADDLLSNQIAFVDTRGRIGIVAPDGSEPRLLSNQTDQIYRFPAWSPDNRYIAAVGSRIDGSGVYLFEADEAATGKEPQELYFSAAQPPFYLYWSPSGQQVSFLANHPDGIGLRLVSINDASDSRLLLTGSPFYWSWSMTGTSLFFHSGLADPDARLAFFDTASQQSAENVSRPGYFQAPGISFDGRYLAYADTDESGGRWVVVDDTVLQEQQRLPHFGIAALGWSPTAPELAILSPTSANPGGLGFLGPLRLYSVQTGETQTVDDGPVLAFFWSPDGAKLAYLTIADNLDGRTASDPEQREGSTPRGKVAQQQEAALRFQLRIYDPVAGNSSPLLTFQPTFLFVNQFLPFFDQYALSHRIWAPDSKSIVLPLVNEDSPEIFIIPLEGVPQYLADGVMAFWSGQ